MISRRVVLLALLCAACDPNPPPLPTLDCEAALRVGFRVGGRVGECRLVPTAVVAP
jgi:hypothetical protein